MASLAHKVVLINRSALEKTYGPRWTMLIAP